VTVTGKFPRRVRQRRSEHLAVLTTDVLLYVLWQTLTGDPRTRMSMKHGP